MNPSESEGRRTMNSCMQIPRRRLLLGGGALLASLPLSACVRTPRVPEVDAAVLGAGFAGLAATRRLREAGVQTVLLEGKQRVGGRVHTLNELQGAPEGGAVEVGHSYSELLQLCREFSIPVGEGVRLPGDWAVHVRGQTIRPEDWAQSAANRLSASERSISPAMLLRHYLPQTLPVQNLDFWGDPTYTRVDIPLAQYLRRAGASEEAIRLIAVNLNCHDIEKMSWADLLRTLLIRRGETVPGTLRVSSGLGRISKGLMRVVGDSLHLGSELLSIAGGRRMFELRCANGRRWRARTVVCTLPFSTLRRVRLDTPLRPAKRALIQRLQYTDVTRVFMRSEREFWRSDGLSPNMWTDTPLGRIFPLPVDEKRQRLVAFSISKSAHILDRMIEEDPRSPLALMEKIRPASKNALEIEKVVSWGRDPMALGAFSHYSAGEVVRYARAAGLPEGRMFFAGEHTEDRIPGMEGALASGRRAAEEALQALRGG